MGLETSVAVDGQHVREIIGFTRMLRWDRGLRVLLVMHIRVKVMAWFDGGGRGDSSCIFNGGKNGPIE